MHGGKWLIYGKRETIENLGSKMKGLVGKDNVMQAKFSKGPALDVPEGYELGRYHVLVVYCDDRKRDSVKRTLRKELGIKEMNWKYDRQTLNDMLERGETLPEHILSALKTLEEKMKF